MLILNAIREQLTNNTNIRQNWISHQTFIFKLLHLPFTQYLLKKYLNLELIPSPNWIENSFQNNLWLNPFLMPASHEFPPKDWSWSTDIAPPLATGPIPIYFSHSNILVDWNKEIVFIKNLRLAASIFGGRFLLEK